MKRVRKHFVLILAVLGLMLAVPPVVRAQGALTLEGLAAQVKGLVARIEQIEEVLEGSGARFLDDRDLCIIGTGHDHWGTWVGDALNINIQDETTLKYRHTFGEWPDSSEIHIVGVDYNFGTEEIAITYGDISDMHDNRTIRYVIEIWHGCEFVGSTEWLEDTVG